MRANAKLRAVTVRNLSTVQHSTWIEGTRAPTPNAAFVEIEPGDGGFYLFRFSDEDEAGGDSWFPTLEEAFAQAAYEYGVTEQDWQLYPIENKTNESAEEI